MGWIRNTIIGTTLLGTLYFGTKTFQNASNWHYWDKQVTKYIEVANGAMTASRKEGIVSMEESLDKAYDNAQQWEGENPAIIWRVLYSDVNALRELTKKASNRAHEIGQLEEALKTGQTSKDSSEWVKITTDSLRNLPSDSPLLKRLSYSEQSQTIASAYEALNDVIAGGTRISGNKVSTEDRSLVYILDHAGGWRSIIRAEADDYKQAAAEVKIALINSNMGYLEDATTHLQNAYELMKRYPDKKNLSIWRDVTTLNQGTLKKSILSAIDKLKEIDNTNPALKYSAGWWDRVAKFGESIGGQETPCLTDLSDNISGRYSTRFGWDITFLLAIGAISASAFFLGRDDF